MVDLKPHLESDLIKNIISNRIYPMTPEKYQKFVTRYTNDIHLSIFAYQDEGEVVGFIGVEVIEPNKGTITHIACSPERRQQGIGSKMIQEICEKFTLKQLSAETDKDAVDFYRKLGFKITSLGEKYPNVERFWCMLDIQ